MPCNAAMWIASSDRWERSRRAALQAEGVSQRQAAKTLPMPRTTLQAWHIRQERLDACPQAVAFFESSPGLAFLHRLVMALHVVFVEIGACGIRLVCRFLELTALHRFVGASSGTQELTPGVTVKRGPLRAF